jgi:neopullulanase
VIHFGKTKQFIPQNNVWVYFRYDDTDTVMVIVNNSLKDVSIPVSQYAEMLTGFRTARDVLTGATLDLTASHWTIPPKTPYITPLAR